MVTLAGALVVAPIFLFLTLFVKDSSVSLLTLLVLAILRSRLPFLLRVAISLTVYAAYGALFREYYLVIALVFGLLILVLQTPFPWRLLYLVVGSGAFLLMPRYLFTLLKGSRDIFNASRVGHNMAGARTAFLNYLPPTDLNNFLVDYIYAALRLNLSPLFSFGIKELFLSFNVLALFGLTLAGLRARDGKVRLPALLYASHLLVLILFEPDLGSYLRHASSVILYLAPALALLDQHLRARPAHAVRVMSSVAVLERGKQ
jgi:hypothetical protein